MGRESRVRGGVGRDESAELGKYRAIRRRILREFNKRLEDFENEMQYNDYLESIEDMIFNLVEGM